MVRSKEAEFLDVIGKKSKSFPLLTDFTPLPSLSKNGLKLVCNVNILYGNLKPENSQDDAQETQRNCTFMNSAWGLIHALKAILSEGGKSPGFFSIRIIS
jgi:hypothetical protein